MIDTIEALVPVFLMILAGRLFGWLAFPSADFWERAATFAYWVLLPALLFRATAKSDLAGDHMTMIAIVVVVPIIITIGVLLLFRRVEPLAYLADPAFVQSCVRQNSYVALAAAFALWGDAGLTILAVVLAVYVPFMNIAGTWLLTRAQQPQLFLHAQIQAICRNPLVLACLAGIGFGYLGFGLPKIVDTSLEIAGRAALPLALLAVGASLGLRVLRQRAGWLAAASAIKLLAFPGLAWTLATSLGMRSTDLAVVVLVAAMPMAASTYPLTRELGGDAEFVASAITVQTVLAMLTVPLIVHMLI